MTNDAEQDARVRAAAERRFDAAMMEIYESAGRDLGYWATRYLQMLRRKGGLATARYLLNAKTTSDGYAHLRDSSRLDLTVEAHVLRPEFAPLFSREELDRARERLAYHEAAMRTEQAKRPPADPQLLELLGQVAAARPADRIGYRDEVCVFGQPAIPVLVDWVEAGNSPGFACAVIEKIGRNGPRGEAIRELRRLRAAQPDWAGVIGEAIERLETFSAG